MTTSGLFAPPPDDFPNRLLSPEPLSVRLPGCVGWLTFLVLACLTLRLIMASRLPGIVPDSPVYINAAKALEAGNLHEAFPAGYLSLYPAILAAMHRLGFDWDTGGVVWGVGISCLVVLPLFGWLRRQYDQRVAVVACLLYAFHPKMIEWAPEIIRDPTFWFFFTLSVYLLWRATTEVRPAMYAAASLAMLASVLSRFEGLVLVFPLVLWSFWRWRALRSGRKRLAVGVGLCIALPVLLMLAANVGLRGPKRLTPRLEPLARVWTWSRTHLTPSAAAGVPKKALPSSGTPITWKRTLWIFFPVMTRGLSPIFAILMFGGIWGWRRTWARRDNQALFLAALANLAGIWIQLWYDQRMCARYALPIVLMAMPFAALGMLGLAQRLVRIWNGCRGSVRWQPALVWTPLILTCAVTVFEIASLRSSALDVRRQAAQLGRWMAEELGPTPMLVGPSGFTSIVHFYMQRGSQAAYRQDIAGANEIRHLVQSRCPDVAVISCTRNMTGQDHKALVAEMTRCGFVKNEELSFQSDASRYDVLVRRTSPPGLADAQGSAAETLRR